MGTPVRDSPALSVVIPTWNRATMVVKAIESVLAQDAPESIEIIVVDDGSQDGSTTVLTEIAGRTLPANRSLHIIHGEHRGRTAAAQRGFDDTAAPYVALLASDDTWAPERTRELMAEERRLGGGALIYTDWKSVDISGRPLAAPAGNIATIRGSSFAYDRRTDGPGVLRSYVTSIFRDHSFPGCVCIFPRPMLQGVFRLPDGAVTVDFWVALAGYLQYPVVYLDTRSMTRCTHAGQHQLLVSANLYKDVVNQQERMFGSIVSLLEDVVPEEVALISAMRGRYHLTALRRAALEEHRLACLAGSLRMAGAALTFPSLLSTLASNLLIATCPRLHDALKYGPARRRLSRLSAPPTSPS